MSITQGGVISPAMVIGSNARHLIWMSALGGGKKQGGLGMQLFWVLYSHMLVSHMYACFIQISSNFNEDVIKYVFVVMCM